MFRWRFLIVFAGLCLPLRAAPLTVGWHVPLERAEALCPQLKEKWRKLDHAPAESAFFQPGDELWDLSEAMHWKIQFPDREGRPAPEGEALPLTITGAWTGVFVVWDARSGQVVARGEPHEIRALENVLDYRGQPVNLQTKMEVVEDPPPAGTGSVRTLTLTSSDDLDALQNSTALSASIISHWLFDNICQVEVELEWPEGEVNVNLKTTVTLQEGRRTCVMKRPHQQVFLTCVRTLPDATLYGVSRTLEKPEGIVPWPVSGEEEQPQQIKLDDGRSALYSPFRLRNDNLPNLGATELRKVAETPAALRKMVGLSLIDLTETLAGLGDKVDFAGYDPFTQALVAVGQSEYLDIAENFFGPTDCKILLPNFRVERSGAEGPLELLCAVSHEASFTLAHGGDIERELALKLDNPGGDSRHCQVTLHQRWHPGAEDASEFNLEGDQDYLENMPVLLGRITDSRGGETSYQVTLPSFDQ